MSNNLLKKYGIGIESVQELDEVALESLDQDLDQQIYSLEQDIDDQCKLDCAIDVLTEQEKIVDEIQEERPLTEQEARLISLGRDAVASSLGVEPDVVSTEDSSEDKGILRKLVEAAKKGLLWVIDKLKALGKFAKEKIVLFFKWVGKKSLAAFKGLKDLGHEIWDRAAIKKDDLLKQGYLIDSKTLDAVDLIKLQNVNKDTLLSYSQALMVSTRATVESIADARRGKPFGSVNFQYFTLDEKLYGLKLYIPGYTEATLGAVVSGKMKFKPAPMEMGKDGVLVGYNANVVKKLLNVADFAQAINAAEGNMQILLKDQEKATKDIENAVKAIDGFVDTNVRSGDRTTFNSVNKANRKGFSLFAKLYGAQYHLSYKAVQARFQFLKAYASIAQSYQAENDNLLESK